MKVLVISNMYPGPNALFGIFVQRQIQYLKKEGIRVHKIVRSKRTFIATVRFYIKIAFDLLVRRSSYDVIHAHYGFHSALIPALIMRSPLVITFHGSDALIEPFRNKIYFILQRYVIKRADRIIAVSNDIKRNIVHRLKGDHDKIKVISCGVDTSVFFPVDRQRCRKLLGISPEKRMVFFVGKLTYMKGVDIIYKCAEDMPAVDFYLAGEGPFRLSRPNFHFLGRIKNDELPVWLNAADLLILPSRSEGTPVAILEAFACGIPVIATSVGGIPDLLSDNHTGYLIPLNRCFDNPGKKTRGKTRAGKPLETTRSASADVFIDKIKAVLSNGDMACQMGRNARHLAEEKYDEQLIARRIIGVYLDMASKMKPCLSAST